MQKFIPIFVVVLVSLVLWFSITSRGNKKDIQNTQNQAQQSGINNTAAVQSNTGTNNAANNTGNTDGISNTDSGSDELEEFDDRPAVEKYKNADEALAALKEAAAIYDDLVLDQFTLPGENCSWCDSLYSSVKELMLSPDLKDDQRAFYSEILAISGRVENLKTLIESAKNAQNPDQSSIYSEALELAVGDEKVIGFLSEQLTDSNNSIKEAAVAALTNQGSRSAIETLYNFSVSQGNADGFYELGIGVGEMVPEEESWPFLQQKALLKDDYSHLAVKALLNVGLEGVKMVSDLYSNNDNPEFVKKVLEQAKEHVAFDDETIEYLRNQSANSKNETLREWYSQLIKEYELSEKELEESAMEENAPYTPIEPAEAE